MPDLLLQLHAVYVKPMFVTIQIDVKLSFDIGAYQTIQQYLSGYRNGKRPVKALLLE
ncbi:MAG: hypothetical protein ACKVP1_17880 [Burkholderiaceae bacterium]